MLLSQPDVILASVSPRRKELLSLIVSKFEVIPSEFDESQVPEELAPADHVTYSACMKSADIAQRYPDSLVIGADTIVVVDDEILGKPSDGADAARMLRLLSGRTHQVYTGVCVVRGETQLAAAECTDVTFRQLDDEIISRYISTGEPMDKAGAYAIQGRGAVLIERISGCYFNVVGLPVYRLSAIMEELGLEPLSG